MKDSVNEIKISLKKSSDIILELELIVPEINKAIKLIIQCFNRGNKVILFGNGGSAADAQHISAEFVGRFKLKRKSLPAIALTSDSSTITSIANDFSFEDVFSRQCESLVKKNDVVIGISTSGNSSNVKNALIISRKIGAKTIGLLGKKGIISSFVDVSLSVNSITTSEIQEAHRVIYHIICKEVERKLITKS